MHALADRQRRHTEVGGELRVRHAVPDAVDDETPLRSGQPGEDLLEQQAVIDGALDAGDRAIEVGTGDRGAPPLPPQLVAAHVPHHRDQVGADLGLGLEGADRVPGADHRLLHGVFGRALVPQHPPRHRPEQGPERFLELTRRDSLADVLAGIDAALAVGFDPVKVNVVCMEGVNDDEVVDFAAFGRERGVEVRFIEWMPLDAGHTWERVRVVPGERIISTIDAAFPLTPLPRGDQPAEVWAYADGAGRVGAIPSVTATFCGSCDRVRLTAEGRLRACLFSLEETDLRSILRSGRSEDDVAAAVEACVAGKWAGHQIGQATFVQPPRSMSQIGG